MNYLMFKFYPRSTVFIAGLRVILKDIDFWISKRYYRYIVENKK